MASQEIYSIDFDSTKFISGVEESLAELSKFTKGTVEFDNSLKKMQDQINKVSFTKPIASLNTIQSKLKQGLGTLNVKGITGSIDEFLKDGKSMEKLLVDLKKQLALTTDGKEFEDLRQGIAQLEQGMAELGITTEETKEKFVPLRTQIKENKLALQEMEAAGLEGTAMFKKMEMETAQLVDQFGDAQASIKTLASDTLALDTGIGAIQGLTAAMQVYEGAMAATGMSTEEIQKSTQKLMAIMNIANGLQTIQNLLQKESAVRKGIDNAVTVVKAVITKVMAKSTEEAVVAQIALNTAMKANPIGAIVAVLTILVGVIAMFISGSGEAEKAQKKFNDELERGEEIMNANIKSSAELNKERQLAIQQIGAAEENLNATAIQQMTKKNALDKKLRKAQMDGLLDEQRIVQENYDLVSRLYNQSQTNSKLTDKERDAATEKYLASLERQKEISHQVTQAKQQDNIDEIDQVKALQKAYTDLNNDYIETLRKYKTELANEQERLGAETPELIKERYARDLKVEMKENAKKYQDLGRAKIDQINAIAKQTSNLQRGEELRLFTKSQVDLRNETIRSIEDLQTEVLGLSIQNIQDQYDRTNEEISAQEKEQIANAKRAIIDYNKTVDENRRKGIIATDSEAQSSKDVYKQQIEERLAVEKQLNDKARGENARAYLQSLTDRVNQESEITKGLLTGQNATLLLMEADKYAKGETSAAKYQRNIAQIQKDGQRVMLQQEIDFQSELLTSLNAQYEAETDIVKKGEYKKAMIASETAISTAQAALKTLDTRFEGIDNVLSKVFGIDPKKANSKEQMEALKSSITSAIGSVTQMVQQQQQAEIDSYNNGIELQQKRVDEASKIADKGNAEYLQQEEERLQALQKKKDEAAKKQIATNAVLQMSEIALALATGIAQGIKLGGPAGIAIEIAAIIGAIASVAAVVSSFKDPTPAFAKGSDYVRRDMREGSDHVNRGAFKQGKDTIPAWLDEGEAVISKDRNSQYNPTIKAIRRGLVPSNIMNSFVDNYGRGINYNRIGQVAKDNSPHFMEMNQRLQRLEGYMSDTAESIRGLAVNVAMDSNGFAASIQTHLTNVNKRNLA
jgi:hypothetical protein